MGEHSKTGRGHVNKYGAKLKRPLNIEYYPKEISLLIQHRSSSKRNKKEYMQSNRFTGYDINKKENEPIDEELTFAQMQEVIDAR